MHHVHVNVQNHEGYWVTFTAHHGQTGGFSVGPWLCFEKEAEMLAFLRRSAGGVEGDVIPSLRQWGNGTCRIVLNDEQYIALLEAGCRDKRNGYQKKQERMRARRNATRHADAG